MSSWGSWTGQQWAVSGWGSWMGQQWAVSNWGSWTGQQWAASSWGSWTGQQWAVSSWGRWTGQHRAVCKIPLLLVYTWILSWGQFLWDLWYAEWCKDIFCFSIWVLNLFLHFQFVYFVFVAWSFQPADQHSTDTLRSSFYCPWGVCMLVIKDYIKRHQKVTFFHIWTTYNYVSVLGNTTLNFPEMYNSLVCSCASAIYVLAFGFTLV